MTADIDPSQPDAGTSAPVTRRALELSAEAIPIPRQAFGGGELAESLLAQVLSTVIGLPVAPGRQPLVLLASDQTWVLVNDRMRIGGDRLEPPNSTQSAAALPEAPATKFGGPEGPEQLPLAVDVEGTSASPSAIELADKKVPKPPRPNVVEVSGTVKWVDNDARLLLLDCGFLVRIDLLAGGLAVKEGDLVRVRNAMPSGKMQVPILATAEPLEVVTDVNNRGPDYP